MDADRRDRFDLLLVGLSVMLVLSTLVDPSGTGAAVGGFVGALVSVSPVVYLVAFAAAGVLFMAYGLLYLPSRESG